MKPIKRNLTFEEHFKQRIKPNSTLTNQFKERLLLFMTGEVDSPLHDHALTGKLAGKRAFSVTGEIRVVYVELEDTIVLLDIGSHKQVYL